MGGWLKFMLSPAGMSFHLLEVDLSRLKTSSTIAHTDGKSFPACHEVLNSCTYSLISTLS